MTDSDFLSQVQYLLVETVDGGLTVSSGLWTPDELQDAANNAQQWVIASGIPFFKRTTLVTTPNETRYTLPQDWILTQRVTWTGPDGNVNDLTRDSAWSADNLQPNWPQQMSTRPLIYNDSEPPLPSIQVMPPGLDNGVLTVWYVAVPAPLGNLGLVSFEIPDMLVPLAKWKTIAILLAKDGRGQDLPRAQWANTLAEQGMAALKALWKGWR